MAHSEDSQLFFARSKRVERAFGAVQLGRELVHRQVTESLRQNEIHKCITQMRLPIGQSALEYSGHWQSGYHGGTSVLSIVPLMRVTTLKNDAKS